MECPLKTDWNLIATLSGMLHVLEERCKWNLSTGEIEALLQSFYKDIKKKIPKTDKEVKKIYENCNVATWGKDHECNPATKTEIKIFNDHIDFYRREVEYEKKHGRC